MSPYVIPGLPQKKEILMGSKLKAEVIIEVVCLYFKVSRSWVIDNRQDDERVHIRQVIMYLLRKNTSMNLIEIALLIRKEHMHHSTIINGVKVITGKLQAKGRHPCKKHIAEINDILKGKDILQ